MNMPADNQPLCMFHALHMTAKQMFYSTIGDLYVLKAKSILGAILSVTERVYFIGHNFKTNQHIA